SGEDNVLFLAGGIAFNIMLAAVPFLLLVVWGSSYVFGWFHSGANAPDAVLAAIDRFLPINQSGTESDIHAVLKTLFDARGKIGIIGAVGFVWFSTRLFGSLRTVLANIFDIESERGIIEGKIFDVKITIVATLLFVANVLVSGYILLATHAGAERLQSWGIRDDVM